MPENEGTVPPDTDITPADPTNSGTALWNKLLKVPAARKLYDWEVKLQVFIQGIWSLQYVALATHWMIKDEFLFFIFPFLTWMLTPMKAFNAVLALCAGEIVNGMLKWLFIWPRPFWIEPLVINKRNTFETDSSFPSSHAQLTMTFVLVCGFQFGGAAVWASLSVLAFVTGLCRVYNGVHFIHDVVVGWAVGAAYAVAWDSADPIQNVLQASLPTRVIVAVAVFLLPPLVLEFIRRLKAEVRDEQICRSWQVNGIDRHAMDGRAPHLTGAGLFKQIKIQPRTIYKYTLQCSTLTGAALCGVFLPEANLLGLFGTCNNLEAGLLRALFGTSVVVLLFLFSFMLVPKLVLKSQVSFLRERGEIVIETVKYVSGLALGIWTPLALHLAPKLGIEPCHILIPLRRP